MTLLFTEPFFRNVFKLDDLGLEILRIAFPAALALAADPIASLIDTVFIGHLGMVPISSALLEVHLPTQNFHEMKLH